MADRKLVVEIVGDSSSFERSLKRSTTTAKKFNANVKGTGTNIGTTSRNVARNIGLIGAAAAGIGVVTGKAFASFEESMDRVVGLAGGARSSVAKFSKEILKIAPSVGKGPQELGDALYFVASAGIAVADQMSVVTTAAKASAAGLGETQVVADAVTSAMNAYGSSVVDAARATDVLVATVREGKGEAAAFAPVIGTVAAIASQLGVSFEEVGAALAAQTRLGIGAETAAVNLQAVFSSLLKETPKTAKALKAVGLSHAGLRDELKNKGLLATLTTLKERFGDNTAAMAQAFPNIRALRGLLSLVGKNAEQVRGVFDRMRDSTGALGTAFGAVSEGEAFKFKQTMASLQVVGIRLGAIFAPVAKLIADGATKALTAVSSFLAELQKAKTVRAKINVILDTGRELGTKALDLAAKIRDQVGAALAKVDWSNVGQQVGDGLVRAMSAIAAFVGSVDWGRVGQSIVRGIGDFLRGVDWVPVIKSMVVLIVKAIIGLDKLLFSAAKEMAQQLARGFFEGVQGLGEALRAKVLELAVKILEPLDFEVFGHHLIPGLHTLIGHLKDELDDLAGHAEKTSVRISDALALHAAGERGPGAGHTKGRRTTQSAAGPTATVATNVATAAVTDQAAAAKAVKTAAEKAKKEAAKLRKAFDTLIDSLSLKQDQAALTRRFADDLKVNAQIQDAIRWQIANEGKTPELLRQLFDARQARNDLLKSERNAAAFKALGLTDTGEERTPGAGALAKRTGSLQQQIKGTILDTPKTRSKLAQIAKVLSGHFGKVGKDVRAAILQMLNDISGALSGKKSDGPQTAFQKFGAGKLLDGVGLSPQEVKELRQRLSQVGRGGKIPTASSGGAFGFGTDKTGNIIVRVILDGKEISVNTTKHQQKQRGRGGGSRRGVRTGGV